MGRQVCEANPFTGLVGLFHDWGEEKNPLLSLHICTVQQSLVQYPCNGQNLKGDTSRVKKNLKMFVWNEQEFSIIGEYKCTTGVFKNKVKRSEEKHQAKVFFLQTSIGVYLMETAVSILDYIILRASSDRLTPSYTNSHLPVTPLLCVLQVPKKVQTFPNHSPVFLWNLICREWWGQISRKL